MNFKKTLAGATAAVIAASSIAVSSGALFKTFEKKDADGKDLAIGESGMYLIVAYYDGSRPSADGTKAVIDYGIDWSKVDSLDYYLTITGDQDFLENTIGGQVGIGSNVDENNGPKNWCCDQFWGVNDAEQGWEASPDNVLQMDKVGDWTYKTTYKLTDDNRPDEGSVIVQLFFQQWSSIAEEAADVVLKDASGNVIGSFDQQGNWSTGMPTDLNLTISSAAAPAADDTAADDTAAPATGDVAAATDSSKGSPDTGIEDVAAVAGLALVAAGAVVVAKKRK